MSWWWGTNSAVNADTIALAEQDTLSVMKHNWQQYNSGTTFAHTLARKIPGIIHPVSRKFIGIFIWLGRCEWEPEPASELRSLANTPSERAREREGEREKWAKENERVGGEKTKRRKRGRQKERAHREPSRKRETEWEGRRGWRDGGMEVAQGAEEGDLTQIGSWTAAAAEWAGECLIVATACMLTNTHTHKHTHKSPPLQPAPHTHIHTHTHTHRQKQKLLTKSLVAGVKLRPVELLYGWEIKKQRPVMQWNYW